MFGAPEVGEDAVLFAQAPDVVGEDQAAAPRCCSRSSPNCRRAQRHDHVRHDLHQADGALRAARPGPGAALDHQHGRHELRIEVVLARCSGATARAMRASSGAASCGFSRASTRAIDDSSTGLRGAFAATGGSAGLRDHRRRRGARAIRARAPRRPWPRTWDREIGALRVCRKGSHRALLGARSNRFVGM